MGRVSRPTAEATTTAKRALRVQVRRRRLVRAAGRTEAERHTEATRLSEAVLAGVRAHRGDGVCRVAGYEARGTEPPTDVLVQRLVDEGYEVVLPVTLPDRDLDWRAALAPESDTLGRDAIATAAVVVVPALAVDRGGGRLGQGGGSYDRALPRRAPGAIVVALVHDDEVLEAGAVPVAAHDIAVDAVVTPSAGWVGLSPAD